MKTDNSNFYIYALYDPEIGSKCLFYIGQTRGSLKKRLNHHCYHIMCAEQGKMRKRNKDKQNWFVSLLKNGNRPSIILIDRCYNQQDADEKERFWISFCKSMGQPLLNKSTGGSCGGTFSLSEEARKKQSEYASNRTEIHKIRNREANRGRKYSMEHNQKCRESRLNGKPVIRTNLKIAQYDLNDNLIVVFNGTMDAVRKTGVSYQAIQGCLWGRLKTGYGFKWKFTNEKFK